MQTSELALLQSQKQWAEIIDAYIFSISRPLILVIFWIAVIEGKWVVGKTKNAVISIVICTTLSLRQGVPCMRANKLAWVPCG